jgi:hypothetical protein
LKDSVVAGEIRATIASTIALISAAVLLLEITFTRILSVVLWYHFAFLSVSTTAVNAGLG